MTRKHQKIDRSSGHLVLIVDDNQAYLDGARLLLEGEGHQVLCARSGPEALGLLRQQPIDLLLLDYFMPGMTGEEVVTQLRTFNPHIQVVLQTGYAKEHPPRELLKRLDIQGYYDKSEGPDKLLLWTDVGLKTAYTVQALNKSRQGLRYILDATPEMHRVQPLTDLLQGILWQVVGLLGAVNSFLAVLSNGGVLHPDSAEADGFLAMLEDDADLIMRAATGRFAGQAKVGGALELERFNLIREVLQRGEIRMVESSTIIPLRIGAQTLGVIYLDRPAIADADVELLKIFANQATVAIQNIQLYEVATLDPLTGVYVRRFFEQWLARELRTAFRSRQPVALLMMDIDKMKLINDNAGHLAGDQALATVGKGLRLVTRESDVVGRYGGDEFLILLPQTWAEGAERVGQRIMEYLQDKSIPGPNGGLALRGSVGLCILEPHIFAEANMPRPIPAAYFQSMAQGLIQKADEALYQSKRCGGNSVYRGGVIEWPPVTAATAPLSSPQQNEA